MDRRKVKTINSIKDALANLICFKDYKDITIQDILDKANIGRSTFYDHYKTKDEVLKSICEDTFHHIFSINHAEDHHDFSNQSDFTHLLTHMLCHFKEDKDMIKGIISSESQDIFLSDLKVQLSELMEHYILSSFNNKNVPNDVLLNHLVTSFMELFLWWIKNNNCEATPTEITRYYLELTLPILNGK